MESEYTKFRAKMRSWQNLVTSSYSIRTSPIYKQSSVCHADTIQLLHVAYTEQSAHQTCTRSSQRIRLVAQILIFVFIHIRHFVPSQFKQCISRFFVKITMAMLMGAIFNKFTGMEVNYRIAIYNKILNDSGSQVGPVLSEHTF